MRRPFHSSLFYHPKNIGRGVQIIKLLMIYSFLSFLVTSSLLGPNILLSDYLLRNQLYIVGDRTIDNSLIHYRLYTGIN